MPSLDRIKKINNYSKSKKKSMDDLQLVVQSKEPSTDIYDSYYLKNYLANRVGAVDSSGSYSRPENYIF